jgi:hypothetical protein
MVEDFIMTTVTNYRNAQYNDDSTVDLEILTDEFGWIPTTIYPLDDDQEPHMIQIKQWLVDNAGLIAAHVPYVPSQAEIDAQALADFKASRTLAVSQIVVTTTSGKTFDGNEEAQNRMARAVAAGASTETTQWLLADNTVATVTYAEIKEALRLAGLEQTALWMPIG